ncbi:UHRF1-binding protein 1 [Papilio machaon]|uniref:UHRF1-binding protein 1 n=1 Tax=Papilio machaon TaxID=76193 RepID=A0A0N0PAI4_PAPMA|nr:UHRF1-binding protein 1 [Papilio machaon]
MVTIIKNQLLKHLSRYTKNLSPEQISLSALRGSGELQDLTLDEDLLTDLLELPAWVRLSSAKCNRVSFRIQWTKLKTVPILLISLSALRGSGELQDLTLDEDLLTDLLELPAWVRLSSAKCNRVSFRIQWTKLKTVPILLDTFVRYHKHEPHVETSLCKTYR